LDAAGTAAMHSAQAQFQSTDGPGPQNWQSDASLKSAALEALADQSLPHALAKNATQADAMQYAKDLLTATYATIAEHGLSGTEAQSRINAAVYLGKAALHDTMPNATPGELAAAFSQQAQQHIYFDQVRLAAAGAATQADAQAALVATTMKVQTLASQALALSDKGFSYDKIDKAEHDGMAQLAAATTDAQKSQAYATALQGIAHLPATPPKDYASAMQAAHDLVEMAYASIEARAASGKPVIDGGAAFLLEAARHTAEKWVMDTHPSALDQAKSCSTIRSSSPRHQARSEPTWPMRYKPTRQCCPPLRRVSPRCRPRRTCLPRTSTGARRSRPAAATIPTAMPVRAMASTTATPTTPMRQATGMSWPMGRGPMLPPPPPRSTACGTSTLRSRARTITPAS